MSTKRVTRLEAMTETIGTAADERSPEIPKADSSDIPWLQPLSVSRERPHDRADSNLPLWQQSLSYSRPRSVVLDDDMDDVE